MKKIKIFSLLFLYFSLAYASNTNTSTLNTADAIEICKQSNRASWRKGFNYGIKKERRKLKGYRNTIYSLKKKIKKYKKEISSLKYGRRVLEKKNNEYRFLTPPKLYKYKDSNGVYRAIVITEPYNISLKEIENLPLAPMDILRKKGLLVKEMEKRSELNIKEDNKKDIEVKKEINNIIFKDNARYGYVIAKIKNSKINSKIIKEMLSDFPYKESEDFIEIIIDKKDKDFIKEIF